MPDRSRIAIGLVTAAFFAAAAVWTACSAKGKDMQEIKFDLGKNIVETAKASGVPKFSVDKVDGLINYSVSSIPADVCVHFTHPGLEIVWQPVFSLSMDADEKLFADRRTDTATLQLDAKFATHASAQAFAVKTIAQFLKGEWKRYHDPDWDTLLGGRSSLLDEQGNVADILMNIDPAYSIPAQDWVIAARNGLWWRWVADGVYAEFAVHADPDRAGTPPAYDMSLKFMLLQVKAKTDADLHEREMREGDAKGWNSTAKYESRKKERLALLRRLEAAALKRGESVLTPH